MNGGAASILLHRVMIQSLKVVLARRAVIASAPQAASFESGGRRRRGTDRCGRVSRSAPCRHERYDRRVRRASRRGILCDAYWLARKQGWLKYLSLRIAVSSKEKGWSAMLHPRDSPAASYSPMTPSLTVPSALKGLTAVFGMGTGVSPSPWRPETMPIVFKDRT